MFDDLGFLAVLLLCCLLFGVWSWLLWRRFLTETENVVAPTPTIDQLQTPQEQGHSAAGRFCPWCRADKGEPCKDFPHGTFPAPYCHICGASFDEPCDPGLHG